ncbi:hypothetical protein L2E82_30840 [Cichorium intybus]|uniref:Uncharacterized protein n=1 Tax=Cichorium intybus TaxID=13427 RepID=A0ACB9D1Y4_CICIN|nr:hypothetical protein L2E82_30840 [Cichorium intybus]
MLERLQVKQTSIGMIDLMVGLKKKERNTIELTKEVGFTSSSSISDSSYDANTPSSRNSHGTLELFHVSSLPAMKLEKLYENAFIYEAIIRALPPLAKKYVVQLLYIYMPVTVVGSFQEWVLADGASRHRVPIDRLIQLIVFTETFDRKK